MSALTSKADISRRHLNVRFVPIADISFHHFIDTHLQRHWYFETQ